MSNGKGSARRPRQVPRKEFDDKWDEVFGQHEWIDDGGPVGREFPNEEEEDDESTPSDAGTVGDTQQFAFRYW